MKKILTFITMVITLSVNAQTYTTSFGGYTATCRVSQYGGSVSISKSSACFIDDTKWTAAKRKFVNELVNEAKTSNKIFTKNIDGVEYDCFKYEGTDTLDLNTSIFELNRFYIYPGDILKISYKNGTDKNNVSSILPLKKYRYKKLKNEDELSNSFTKYAKYYLAYFDEEK